MKTMSPSQIQPQRKFRSRSRLLAAAVSSCFAASVAWANPVAPTVVNGVATFSQAGNVLTVTNSNGAIINWNKFSIGSGETTYFLQSSASSSVLNRVLSSDPSVILGTLGSNGKVWLINPAGIMVGAGARVDVAGFVASTLNVSDANFLAGKLLFDATPGAGSVVNQGAITTPSGGSVYLIAPNVQNAGVIATPGGETILAAGQTVALLDTGTPGVKVEITGAEGNATNLGTILADAGRIGMAGVLVRNSGTLNASSVVNEGGRVFLKASQDAYVDGNGRIVTTGAKGGTVEVLGRQVSVTDNASIDASGVNGGGTVLVGGDYQGKNATVQNSQTTYVGANTTIKADATGSGNGGKVIVWADDTTQAAGSISARGGMNGGNGGFIEVSGAKSLQWAGLRADTRAPKGKTGTLLFDPGSLTINDALWSAAYGGITSNLILQTDSSGSGDITFTGSGANNTFGYDLSVLAYGGGGSTGNISFNNFKLSVAGNLRMQAGWDGVSTSAPLGVTSKGAIAFTDSKVQSNGTMGLYGGLGISLTASTGQTFVGSAGRMTVKAGGNITLQAANSGNNLDVLLGSYGGQDISAASITLTGGNGSGVYGNSAAIANISDSADQNITIYGGGAITLAAGSGDGVSPYGGGSFNAAVISHSGATAAGTGTKQKIDFYNGGTLTIQGGSAGTDNWAGLRVGTYINNTPISFGNQWIGSSQGSAYAPNINLTGGSGGGAFHHSNDASIGMDDDNAGGTQTVYASNISISGGGAGYGGAGFSAPTQRFYITNGLYMSGGSSTQLDQDDIPGATAYIGSKYGADIEINAGYISLWGGSGSPVLIGSLSGVADVTITTTSANTNYISSPISGTGGGVFIGSRAELGTGFLSDDIMMGSDARLYSGGNVEIRSYGGNVGLGYIKTNPNPVYGATITAYGAILDQNGSALNLETDHVTFTSQYGGASSGIAISADTLAAAAITAQVNAGSPFGGISIRNLGAAPTGNIVLTDASAAGGDISFFNTGSLTLNTSTFNVSTATGDLLIATGGNLSSTGFAATIGTGGSMLLGAGGDVNIAGNTYAKNSSFYYQDVGVVAAGNINLQSGYFTGDDIALVALGDLNVSGNSYATTSSGTMTVIATNVNVDGSGSWGYLRSYGDMNILAKNVTLTNGGHIEAGFSSPNSIADISIAVTDDIRLNNGSYIVAGNDIYLDFLGSNSTLYVNDGLTANQAPSHIWADAYGIPATTYINFAARSSGGIVINGTNATTTTVGGSGFFNGIDGNYDPLPAVLGSSLKIEYGVVDNPATNLITQVLDNTKNNNNLGDKTTTTTTLVLKPTTTTAATDQTVGGDSEDSFGGGEKKDDKKDQNGNSDTKGKSNGKSTSKNQCS